MDERVESLVKTAQEQGLPRPVAEQIVEEAMAKNDDPRKLEEAVREAARIEKEDRDLNTGKA
jgi:hypothetical protein